jgi:hypothetical protein
VKTPLDISLSELADAANAAARKANIEAQAAGIEPAGVVTPSTEPRRRAYGHKVSGRASKRAASQPQASTRRKIGG